MDDLLQFDISKTLAELEGTSQDTAASETYLMKTAQSLMQKPLRDFTAEDLRLMIGQNVHLDYLLPMALVKLQQDPFLAGDYYPGDLLLAVLRANPAFWTENPALLAAAQQVYDTALTKLGTLDDINQKSLAPQLADIKIGN